jgi:hypothetical protein
LFADFFLLEIHGQSAGSQQYGYYIKFYLIFQLHTLTLFNTTWPFSAGFKLMHQKITLPPSSAHSARKTHNRYMEAISEMRNDAKLPMYHFQKHGSTQTQHHKTS